MIYNMTSYAQIELILDNEPLWRRETSLVASVGFSRYRRCSRLTAAISNLTENRRA